MTQPKKRNIRSALQTPYYGKATNIQPFLNSLLIDVQKYHLEDAVTVTVNGAPVNLITDYGSITKTTFFDDARKAMIAGVNAAGNPVALAGRTDAARLLQARLASISRGILIWSPIKQDAGSCAMKCVTSWTKKRSRISPNV